jgi:adenine-specific DNA-methyltransferase
MMLDSSRSALYDRRTHAARGTGDYIFNQLIPYIGNKRKLLDLIGLAIEATGVAPEKAVFLDAFAGSGVVSRFAKKSGFQVLCNDWEPYAEQINLSAIACAAPPSYGVRSYEEIIAFLNDLPDREGWITKHLCPQDDSSYDLARDRLFYTRANGKRLDAIRGWIRAEEKAGRLDAHQKAALLCPLLYQACYTSNTSGVFKGFHNGWGGKTGTALYRIKSALTLQPALFFDNHRENRVFRKDALALAEELAASGALIDIAYLDPPYNQHPYGSNYHVLNTIALDDAPDLSPRIEGRNKAAIRLDWRAERRSAYNYRAEAVAAYRALLDKLPARWVLTSYSTDGTVALEDLVAANCERGATDVVMRGYKRYRVSSQRFSEKPMNVEFVLATQKGVKGGAKAEAILAKIRGAEESVLAAHAENGGAQRNGCVSLTHTARRRGPLDSRLRGNDKRSRKGKKA